MTNVAKSFEPEPGLVRALLVKRVAALLDEIEAVAQIGTKAPLTDDERLQFAAGVLMCSAAAVQLRKSIDRPEGE